MRSVQGNVRPWPWCTDWVIARSIHQGRGLRFPVLAEGTRLISYFFMFIYRYLFFHDIYFIKQYLLLTKLTWQFIVFTLLASYSRQYNFTRIIIIIIIIILLQCYKNTAHTERDNKYNTTSSAKFHWNLASAVFGYSVKCCYNQKISKPKTDRNLVNAYRYNPLWIPILTGQSQPWWPHERGVCVPDL